MSRIKAMEAIKGLIVIKWKNHQTTLANLCVAANRVKKLNAPTHYCCEFKLN
jgi:hypothetical protein